MSRIRYRSPLRAVVYEMRGLFLWWGLLAAATSILLLWHVRQARPALFAPAVAVALAAWSAPVLALWSLLSPRRPDSLPADGGDGDGWRKSLHALARFLIYLESRGGCDRETKALLRDGEKRVRAALKGVHGAKQLQAAWNDVRTQVVAVWAEKTWQRVRPGILAIAREAAPEGADAYGHRSSRNWRAAREVFAQTLPQGLALERSRWEIRSEVMALFCAQDGRFPGVPVPVLAGLFALALSDLSLPWDSGTAIERIRPWAEREARLLAEEGFAVEPAAGPAAAAPVVPVAACTAGAAGPVADPPAGSGAPPEPAPRHSWKREEPETALGQDPTTSRVPPRPVGTVHFSTHAYGASPAGRRHHHRRHAHHGGWKKKIARDFARIGEAFLTFAQRLRYSFRIRHFG